MTLWHKRAGVDQSGNRAIPDLSPARWYLAITALNYRLMVCGGVSTAGTHSDCKWLDTNSPDPVWQDMNVSSVSSYFMFNI